MTKRRKTKGRESGSYVALPHSLLRHPNFISLSPRATKLFLDLASNYVGNNNGDLSCAWKQMKARGWKSHDQVFKAQTELLEKGFLMKTRQGGRNKCNLYALTLWSIDECKGKLDVSATNVPSHDWKKSFSVALIAGDLNPPQGLIRPKGPPNLKVLTRHEGKSCA
jgi:hypothetical protein